MRHNHTFDRWFLGMLEQTEWLYERGDNRHKHHWKKDEAGFVPPVKGGVGKCHASITTEIAQELLRQGVRYNAPGADDVTHVYAVYRGTIYEAAPTRPGISFHGYPWRGGQGRPALPPRVVRALRAQADKDNCLKGFEDWLNKYS